MIRLAPLVSLILPYWQRQDAADRALSMLAQQYESFPLEVIVIDDGSPEPFIMPDDLPFYCMVVRLPKKDGPLSSCVPFNRGVSFALGQYIALSSVEILHTQPVLQAMVETIQEGGPETYVLAACLGKDDNVWHCHSSKRRTDKKDVGSWLPPGSDYHFMSMMSRDLWERAGGLDEAYRDGAGYEDADFVRRLHAAGARFVIRDDLVVHHPRQDARANWRPEMFAKNRELFMSKWDRLI